MLTKREQSNLETHVLGIFQTVVLPEITPGGAVLTREADGRVIEDYVATHHLVELCVEVDATLFKQIIHTACQWFAKTHGNPHNPFMVTTLARAGAFNDTTRDDIAKAILAKQKPSGFFELYSGFLDGGNIFSTLWAIRILQLLGRHEATSPPIRKALNAIEGQWEDVHRTSFKGFFFELRHVPSHGKRPSAAATKLLTEIIKAQADNGLWDGEALYTAYVLGNLTKTPWEPTSTQQFAEDHALKALFSLRDSPQSLPSVFLKARKKYHESTYLQLCFRSLISSIRYLRMRCGKDMSHAIASVVMGSFPTIYHTAQRLGAELKRMDAQYGAIQAQFSHLDPSASVLLKESPYERNVFVMMPFRKDRDERYERIESIIRQELKKHGFTAWLASDKTVAPQLWDNVASFLLACKYGIAVFTRIEKESTIQEEFNPNVSLELGFCLSRGRSVLILKDSFLPRLQTDLIGYLYKQFDLNQVTRQLPRIVRAWIRDILKAEECAKKQPTK
ncbi:MAG TPA: hypothetical protein P5567_14000 [Kiritimatiellia bacterium]|nr:hypothetical protein [Kiritimatiellia bacterium]HRZ13554.1 hypothetical protein [Kiritimatiellia bacterium]HSA19141.1 hypothetical protein [Kiritimatiellia bacterium]